jgi:cyclic beta-1,2-glucan synthetase
VASTQLSLISPPVRRTLVLLLGAAGGDEARATCYGAVAASRPRLRRSPAVNAWGSTRGVPCRSKPGKALDALAKGCLIYQVLLCRLWTRNAFYQSGGALGFRLMQIGMIGLGRLGSAMTRRLRRRTSCVRSSRHVREPLDEARAMAEAALASVKRPAPASGMSGAGGA